MSAVRWLRVSVAGVVAVIGLATLVGFLDRIAWVFEIADVFRVQYAAVLVVAAVGGLALQERRLALVAVALAAVNVAALRIDLAPAAVAAPGVSGSRLRLVVANVEVGNTDFAAVERLVELTHPDLFGVTELTPAMAHHLATSLTGYRSKVLAVRDDAYGIGVYSRLPIESARVAHLPADGPPTIVAHLRVADKPVAVVITHVRTVFAGSIHVRQLHALAAARPTLGGHVIVCGDFNTPPWSGPLRHFASTTGLRDLYGGRAWAAYTWPTWFYGLRVPIDDCFVSGGVGVADHRDGPDVGSDHRPLVVDVRIG
jgi:endonuclease/exonuclease/phosphatase (EEP) superfamily protein YafD